MKITNIEKVIIGMMVVLVFAVVGTSIYTAKLIDEAGGIKQVIIDSGKEIKSIGKEINSGDNSS